MKHHIYIFIIIYSLLIYLFDEGNGDSEGSFDYANYFGEVEEIKCAKRFLVERGHEVICLVGNDKMHLLTILFIFAPLYLCKLGKIIYLIIIV